MVEIYWVINKAAYINKLGIYFEIQINDIIKKLSNVQWYKNII